MLHAAPRPCETHNNQNKPNNDGWELLRASAGEPALRDIPLVCTTAGRDERPQGRGAILRKPFDDRALVAAVRSAFAARATG